LRATVWTLLTTAGVAMGHWLIWMCCGPLFLFGGGGGEGMRFVFEFQAFGLTPPLTLALLAFGLEDLSHTNSVDQIVGENACSMIVGLICWGVAAAVLRVQAADRFHKLSGRTRKLIS
jgi:hypothetical protein